MKNKITCSQCNGPVPEGWQQLSHNDRENLKRTMGIVPVCVECIRKKVMRGFPSCKVKE